MTDLVSICLFCHRRKNDDGKWVEDEKAGEYPFGTIGHGVCPPCAVREYGEDEDEQSPTGEEGEINGLQ